MPEIAELWRELEAEPVGASGALVRRVSPAACCPVYIAVERPSNRRVFQLEVDAAAISAGTEYPQSAGLQVEPESLTGGAGGQVRIVTRLLDAQYADIFTVIIQDMISAIGTSKTHAQVVRSLLHQLSRWQAFLRKHGPGGLSRQEQQGLYGELTFLYRELLPALGPDRAVHAWTGQRSTSQDFQHYGCGIEVKTSSAGSDVRMEISSSRQLDDTGVSNLLVYLLLLDIRQGTDCTLPDLIDEIRTALEGESAAALAELDDLLSESGWLDSQRDLYGETSYAVRETYYFLVSEGFPRIVERDLMPGVDRVKYAISLSACLPFEVTVVQARICMTGESDE